MGGSGDDGHGWRGHVWLRVRRRAGQNRENSGLPTRGLKEQLLFGLQACHHGLLVCTSSFFTVMSFRLDSVRPKRGPVQLLIIIVFLLPQSREVDGDGVSGEGALHLQFGSGGLTRGSGVGMLATSPAAAALSAHHHPAQGSQP